MLSCKFSRPANTESLLNNAKSIAFWKYNTVDSSILVGILFFRIPFVPRQEFLVCLQSRATMLFDVFHVYPRASCRVILYERATAKLFWFRSPNESMNADIVLMLCPYLDLGSLLSMTAAYPKWSHIIRKHIEKKKLQVSLTVVGEVSPSE